MEVFEQLWEYNRWANSVVLDILERLGEQLPPSSLRLMSHIVNAQSVWLDRLVGRPPVFGVWDEHDLADCKRLNAETLEGLRAVILQPFATPAQDILLQVFNHGTYHRAQIATDLRQHGSG